MRDALLLGPPSLQGPGTTYGENEPAGSENCLVLNVWTPAVNDGRRRPVMVYSHGGGYVSGSGGSRDKDGARLAATYHVVVVTTNHRLGLLGYLYPDAPPTAASVPLIVGYNHDEATFFFSGQPEIFHWDDAALRSRARAVFGAARLALPRGGRS